MVEKSNILAVVAILNTWLLSGGLIYGWGPVHTLLVSEGQYNSCSSATSALTSYTAPTKCASQEEALERIFNSSFIALSVMSVVFGLMLDKFGPRISAFVGILMSLTGNLLFAFSDWKSFDGFLAGYALIAGGGIAPFLCHFNFGNLFERNLLFMAIINTFFNVSGFNYLLIGVLGFSRKAFFLTYAFIAIIGGLAALLFYPNKAYAKGDECELPISRCFSSDSKPMLMSQENGQDEDEEDLLLKQGDADRAKSVVGFSNGKTFWKELFASLLSKQYIFLDIWYALNLLVVSFISSAIPDILSQYSDRVTLSNGKDLYTYLMFPILSNIAFIFAPLSGIIIEKVGFAWLILLTNISTSLVLLFSIAPKSWTIHVQLITLVLCAVQKGFLFNAFYSYLAVQFPININGSLVAVTTATAAIVGLSTYGLIPLTQYTFDGSYTYTNLGLFVLTLPMYLLAMVAFQKSGKKASFSAVEVNHNAVDDEE
jgi:MFS family permease